MQIDIEAMVMRKCEHITEILSGANMPHPMNQRLHLRRAKFVRCTVCGAYARLRVGGVAGELMTAEQQTGAMADGKYER